MSTQNDNRLGTIHGAWLWMFKVALAMTPFAIGWGVWVTTNIFEYRAWSDLGPRFTPANAEAMELRLTAGTDRKIEILASVIRKDLDEIKTRISELPKESPPKWWEDFVRERILEHGERIKALEQRNGVTQ